MAWRQEQAMRYRVLIQQDEDGMYVAEVPSLPGCISQGAWWCVPSSGSGTYETGSGEPHRSQAGDGTVSQDRCPRSP